MRHFVPLCHTLTQGNGMMPCRKFRDFFFFLFPLAFPKDCGFFHPMSHTYRIPLFKALESINGQTLRDIQQNLNRYGNRLKTTCTVGGDNVDLSFDITAVSCDWEDEDSADYSIDNVEVSTTLPNLTQEEVKAYAHECFDFAFASIKADIFIPQR